MKRTTRWLTGFVAVFLSLMTEAAAPAGSLTPGNILVSTEYAAGSIDNPLDNSVFEYTTTGTLVQQFVVPYPGGRTITETVRGIAVNTAGQVQIYNGSDSPYLTTLTPTPGGSPGQGTYTNTTFTGWRSDSNETTGEIATLGNYVFAGSMTTGSGGSNGIIRFDTANSTATMFATGTNYSSVTVGANGLLYAINQFGYPTSEIDVFNPYTLKQVQTINLSLAAFSNDLRALAVDANGNIFAAGAGGYVDGLNSSGDVVNSLFIHSQLGSIAIDGQGDLVVGNYGNGDVYLTTTALTGVSSTFNVGATVTVHVNFTSPLIASVPEPSSVLLAGTSCVMGLGWWAGRRRTARLG
jgi:hypothetical protein